MSKKHNIDDSSGDEYNTYEATFDENKGQAKILDILSIKCVLSENRTGTINPFFIGRIIDKELKISELKKQVKELQENEVLLKEKLLILWEAFEAKNRFDSNQIDIQIKKQKINNDKI